MHPIHTMDLVHYFCWNILGLYKHHGCFLLNTKWSQWCVSCNGKFILLSKVGLPRVDQKLPYYSHNIHIVWSCMNYCIYENSHIIIIMGCLYFLNTLRTTPPIPIICVIWVFNNISYIRDGFILIWLCS